MSQQSEQVRSDAAEVLRDVLRWRLPPARWDEVSLILAPLEVPLGLADPGCLATLSRVSVQLELAGPQLLTPIEEEATLAPDGVRDRVNSLIHELSKPTWPDDGEAAG
jgi:hypothetical protein